MNNDPLKEKNELHNRSMHISGMMDRADMADTQETIVQLRKEVKELEKELERKKNLLATYEAGLIGKHLSIPRFDKDALLRPEYRKGGYFTSQDYYDKCDEFHRILEEHDIDYMKISRGEYIYLKKEFFQNTYGITWLSEEEQFLPGTKIDVHAERL